MPTAAPNIFLLPGHRTVAEVWADECRAVIAAIASKPRNDLRDQFADRDPFPVHGSFN